MEENNNNSNATSVVEAGGLSNGVTSNTGGGDTNDIMETSPSSSNNNGDNNQKKSRSSSASADDEDDDDDESVLSLSKQTNRPRDVPIQQQRINAWHPILDPNWMIVSYLILALIMIPFGYHLAKESDNIVELTQLYDAGGNTDMTESCPSIGINYNANENCTLTFNVTKQMDPPVLIYYELTNFHQNYRSYTESRDDYQLTGTVYDDKNNNQDKLSKTKCHPINVLGNTVINPCGLIANTFFNDKFTLGDDTTTSAPPVDDLDQKLILREDGIAWQSDLKYRFKMPNGFNSTVCPDESAESCDSTSTCCTTTYSDWSCTVPAINQTDNKCYAYNYPQQDTTQYLYQTYPTIISPLEHVTNEHFIVWMRIAAQPKFRKLYGYIDQTIPAGTILNFNVNMNYVVESFGGTKSFTITTNSMWGTKDSSIGITIYSIGYFCLACGIFFGLKQYFRPRKIADRKYLHYKEE